jgi:hypothetical protein
VTQIQQVELIDNLFVFDVKTGTVQNGRASGGWVAISGCKDSCAAVSGGTYAGYQLFQGNAYWSDADSFDSISNAFQVLQNQGSGPGGVYQESDGEYACSAGPVDDLTFVEWQTGNIPIPMDEDAGGTANMSPQQNNHNFPTSGTSANMPQDFTINNTQGLGQFNANGTNAAITGAGSTVTAPSSVCSTASPTVTVCPTYPTFVYGSGNQIF